MALKMAQEPIGQRIKFLIDSQKISVRRFAQLLDVGETNIRNYIDKGTKPSSDAIEKMAHTFPQLNLAWLITGQGEPFLSTPDESTENIHVQKNFRSPIVGANHGTAHQEQHVNPGTDEKGIQLALAQKEIEGLKAELARADALLAAKDETIGLLKAAFKNPN